MNDTESKNISFKDLDPKDIESLVEIVNKASETKIVEETGKTKNTELEIDISDILFVLLRRWWIILLSTALCAVASFTFFYQTYTPQYTATAKVYVNNDSISSVGASRVSISTADLSASISLVETYCEILKTRLTLEEVISHAYEKYGYQLTYNQLLSSIKSGPVENTAIFSISVTNSDPQCAINLTNIILEVLPDQIQQVIDGSSVRTVDNAKEAVAAESGMDKKALIGAAGGFVLSAGILIIIDLILNDTLEDTEWLRRNYGGVPILAEIPDTEAHNRNDKRYYKRYYRNYYRRSYYGKYYGYYGKNEKTANNETKKKNK